MGGRSRNANVFSTRWSWLKDVSNARLEQYGRMSGKSIANDNRFINAKEQAVMSQGRVSLHIKAAEEYERRNGRFPTWFDASTREESRDGKRSL